MERFVKIPIHYGKNVRVLYAPHIDEFRSHRKGLVARRSPLVERTTIESY